MLQLLSSLMSCIMHYRNNFLSEIIIYNENIKFVSSK